MAKHNENYLQQDKNGTSGFELYHSKSQYEARRTKFFRQQALLVAEKKIEQEKKDQKRKREREVYEELFAPELLVIRKHISKGSSTPEVLAEFKRNTVSLLLLFKYLTSISIN